MEEREHTLHRRQTQLLRHVGVLDFPSLIKRHATDQLGQVAARRDSAATAKCLEHDVVDLACILVHTDLQLHDIATGRGADEAGANVLVALLEGADVPRVVVVIQDLLVVSPPLSRGRSWCLGETLGRLDGLDGGEGSERTGRRSADAGSDGNETLEHCCLYVLWWLWYIFGFSCDG